MIRLLGYPAHLGTKGNGIEYGGDGGFICFCEMKWYSDISKDVTHDKYRNQLVRVIDNALMFEDKGMLPERIFVTLVTPKVFKERKPKSRLYTYKFEEYANERAIFENLAGCDLFYRSNEKEKEEKLQYHQEKLSQVKGRLQRHELKWTTYEDLIDAMEDDGLSGLTHRLKRQYGLGLVIVDYLQLVKVDGDAAICEKRAMLEVVSGLKRMAKTLSVAVLGLVQWSNDTDRRPQP